MCDDATEHKILETEVNTITISLWIYLLFWVVELELRSNKEPEDPIWEVAVHIRTRVLMATEVHVGFTDLAGGSPSTLSSFVNGNLKLPYGSAETRLKAVCSSLDHVVGQLL